MIKPNWYVFRVKFSENPQNYFEWFCYLLFCKESNNPLGIFRYKDQSAIETEPVNVDGDIVGWQAKFYDVPLSNHKDDILETLDKLKRDYPNITKLLFYTNQEWGQYKGKKPKGLTEIENKSKSLKITIDWRPASFFESAFVCQENEIIARHFFTAENSVLSLMEELQQHTQNILSGIHTCITFNNNSFEICRNNYLDKLNNTSQQISIISGIGGVGKTVLIEKLYAQLKDTIPFYVFKASEFDLRNINDLFANISVSEFIKGHREEKNKIVVIDSSEKLLDLTNTDPFKEFLTILIKENWKVIFTTRHNYLEDLNYQFFEIYNVAPLNISISQLNLEELRAISDKYSFLLPKDEKLLDLIKIPFYLNEYLKYYNDKEELEYSGFKTELWNRNIKKSKPARERCFLQIAFERANSGHFFVIPDCESNILDDELTKDGILGYETPGYFITHDIYEEWALEKIIESEFIKETGSTIFFEKIGESLPIRRCFRNWLSEKLLLENDNIYKFIEQVIGWNDVASFWKDEILISILLSNYSETFFECFRDELLAHENRLLKRLTFMLRIACKEIDDNLLQQLGTKDLNLFSLKYVMTRPKGQGWESLIKFVFDNIEIIDIKNITFVLPVIYDWNSKIRQGITTRYSSLIALRYYQWAMGEDSRFLRNNKEGLLKTILYGSSEIKEELTDIFEQILQNKGKNYRSPYYDLSQVILTELDGLSACHVLPEYILKLADLFWTYTPEEDISFYRSRAENAQYFGLESVFYDYFPPSAYQTPIYWLLHISLQKTIDFILEFTNKSIQCYANSAFDNSVKKIEVAIGDIKKEQFISHCLWNIYRGTSSPCSPYLLQSIHMALEKFFLEMGKDIDSKILENWLIYLLRNSISASITAVISSIVLAYPEKTFNVAKVLFQTKEFIFFDTARLAFERGAKALYSMGSENKKLYNEERMKTCEDKHRKWSLEQLFLKYQCFQDEGTSEEEAEGRQKILWEILDNYYQEMPEESEQSESDKTWRLFLARMDKRKMNITTEMTDDGIIFQFNPKLEPNLKEYSENSLSENSELTKYASLRLWAELKINNDEKYKNYENYENDPLFALQEVKDILKRLNKTTTNENFFIFNRSTPAYVCSLLLENNLDELSAEDKSFCKDIILEVVGFSLNPNYRYQVSDGVQPAISSLSTLLRFFPEEKDTIKIFLLLSLFNEYSVGGIEQFSIFPITTIHKLWKTHFDDAQSILLGYLLLKPRYNEFFDNFYKNNNYETQKKQLMANLEDFLKENQKSIEDIVKNKISLSNVNDIDSLDLRILKTVFQLIPQKTDCEDHKKIAKMIIEAFAKEMLSHDRNEELDYEIKHNFLQTYAYFVLNLPKGDIRNFLMPFINNFSASEDIASLFDEYILAENGLNTNNRFWLVWNLFKEKIFEVSQRGDNFEYIDKTIKSYLFAQIRWEETAREWHSLQDNNKAFFKEVSEKIGHRPSVLYAISKLLNGIGSRYIDEGVDWISSILENNQDYLNKKLEINTIYYMENLCRKYSFRNREKLKKSKVLKDKLIVILNFLIERGSTVGYMLRESIV